MSWVATWLQPGGTLIYATCSLERPEGEDQIKVADAAGLRLLPITSDRLGAGIVPDRGGWVRVLPVNHADGFFIAHFIRP